MPPYVVSFSQENGPEMKSSFSAQAVKFGGQKEYDAVKAIWKNPPTPSVKVAALYVSYR